MSQFNVSTRQTGPLPPLVGPISTPTAQPAAEPPAAASVTVDQYQAHAQTPQIGDMGPLPWESAEVSHGPEAPFANTPEYQQLSETEQATLKTFFETTIQGNGAGKAEEMATRLAQLLTQGKFAAKDAFGQGLMDHLAAFNQAPLNDALQGRTSKDKLARELVTALADPASVMQGQGTAHCAEATLEATLAYTQPADYARIATELVTKGQARIPGPPGGPNPDTLQLGSKTDLIFIPSDLSAMLQRSFEARVAGRPAYWSGGDSGDAGPSGLNPNQVKALYDGIIGSDHLTMYANQGTDLLPAIKQALGHQGAIKVTMRSEDGLHSVAVTGISDKGVAIWDPATGKHETLSSAQFNSLVVRATLDRNHLDQDTVKRQEQAQWQIYGDESGSFIVPEKGGRLGARAQQG
ncbi:hypothetical protein J7643_11780 [bacterium]|nr:hypothetical protein [bacterium]